MKGITPLILFSIITCIVHSQGYNHQWLLGNNPFAGYPNGRAFFDSTSYTFITEYRKMSFKGTEANISDAQGNLLMSSNGIWIANANGDTMLNGSGLNPSPFTNNWPNGFPINYMNLIINSPADSEKYFLFHQTLWQQLSPCISGFYKTTIDLSLNGGLGSVIQKNDTLLADTLSNGIGACKHANGRDWWVFVMRDHNPEAFTFLVTPNGIDSMFTQNMNFMVNTYGNVSPIVFSQDGSKMIYSTPVNQAPSGTVLLYDFDRCTGLFSNMHSFPISTGSYLLGLAFSPSGKYAYTCTSNGVYQIDTDSLIYTLVATYDGFISPGPNCCATTFWGMYLAANGKIYITSGSSVKHIHELNNPDSAGITCDVQQHAIDLIDYLNIRAVPNHPNYYLGPVQGSICDSLTGVDDHLTEILHFSIRPNPNNGDFSIMYMLPQSHPGWFELYDILGKQIYKIPLPPWSTLQQVSLPKLSNGIYNAVISSGGYRASKKIAIIDE